MTTTEQLTDAKATARRVAKARRQGDEHLAQHLTRSWKASLPPYGTDARRDLEQAFRNAYTEYSGVNRRSPDLRKEETTS